LCEELLVDLDVLGEASQRPEAVGAYVTSLDLSGDVTRFAAGLDRPFGNAVEFL